MTIDINLENIINDMENLSLGKMSGRDWERGVKIILSKYNYEILQFQRNQVNKNTKLICMKNETIITVVCS